MRRDSTSVMPKVFWNTSLITPTVVGPNTRPMILMIKSSKADAAARIARGARDCVMPKVGPVYKFESRAGMM